MKRKRIISIICLVSLLAQGLPVKATVNFSETLEDEIKNEEIVHLENAITEDEKEKLESENIENDGNEVNKGETVTSGSIIKEENTINDAPKITGSESVRVYLGEEIDYKYGIKAIGINGQDITDLVTVEGKADTSKVGTYEVKYSVTDEFGKTTTLTRKINVIEKNTFNAYVEKINESTKEIEKESLFTIYLDNKTSKFVVENQSSNKIDESRGNEIAFQIKVIDKDNKEKLNVELLGNDTGDSKKLDKLKELEYSYGDYIQIKPMNLAKKGFNITGAILGEITSEKEDYSDGIDNLDYINNVRFEITEEGLKSVYNKAPVFEGLENIDEKLNGLKVIDDHDGVIPNSKVNVIENDDTITYSVADSWGRVSSVIKSKTSNLSMTTQTQGANQRTLADNIITVKGTAFITENGPVDIRFKINFDPVNMKITVTERDGKIFTFSNEEYFKFILHSSNGEVKQQVIMTGRDRSDSEKLNAIDNISFEFGDYISVWHAESNNMLYIGGQVADVDTPNQNHDYSNGVPNEVLARRFRITSEGLTLVTNRPPTIHGADTPLEIERGATVDLLDGVTATDELDGNIDKSKIKVDPLDTKKAGRYQIKYEVSDSWGETTTVIRQVTVKEQNDIDGLKINVMNKGGSQKLFTITFDELSKSIRIVNKLDSGTIDSSNKGDAFIFRIYNKFGRIKKTFRIKGNTSLNSNIIRSMDGYKYVDGDYISIWASDHANGVRIEGNIQNEKEDYDDGIQNVDHMDNVRFQLIDGKVNSIYNEAPKIIGATDKTIKRGEGFNALDGISVDDDHDKDLTTNDIEVIFENGITADNISLKKGRHTVTYKLKDKWGRERVINRTINVDPKNKLEETQIVLKSSIASQNDDVMLKIGFDTILKKLTVDYYNDELYIEGNPYDTAFKVIIRNQNNSVKKSFILNYDHQLTKADINEINNLTYDNGDKISVEAYDPEDGISITGEIISPEATYDGGFTHNQKLSQDIMLNTTFEISEQGLDDKYNEAPRIVGIDDAIVVKGRQFDKRNGVSVEDDQDTGLNFTVDEDVDTNTIGTYILTYTATDSLGRRTSVGRTIYVVPEYTDTYVELKNSNNEKLFSIGLNRFGNGFILKNLSTQQISPGKSDVVFRFTVFNQKGEEVDKVELLGTDTADSDKLKKLETISFRDGYSFSIWSDNPSNLMVSGNITKETVNNNQAFTDENYSDGISNEDLMVNVRFKISDENLVAVYNSAPVLSITGDYEMYRGESIDLTKGVTVSDDMDTIDISTVKVKINGVEATKEKLEELSQNTSNTQIYQGELTYQISDKWGRESQEVRRTIRIKPGMERHEFKFQGRIKNTNGSEELFFDAIKFKFDTNTMKFKLLERANRNFSFHVEGFQLYSMTILNSDKTVKGEWTFKAADKATDSKYDSIETTDIKYGDIIKFTTSQSPKLTISGEMYNTHNDYSNGMTSAHQLEDTEFVITKEGLVENHTESIVPQNNKNIISILTGFVGNTFYNIELNPTTHKFEVSGNDVVDFLDYRYKNIKLIRFEFYAKNGTVKERFSLIGGYQNDEANKNLFTGFQLEEGDYFRMYPEVESNAKLFRILGDLEKDGDVEDYSDGIDNVEESKHTRFYITSTGAFRAVHNKAPVIKVPNEKDGIVNIPVGSNFDKNSGVTVEDDRDPNLTFTSSGDVNTNQVGDHKVTYTATDSWGRTTTKVVTFKVRPKAFFNNIEVYREGDKANPAIVIGIDNETNKYTVTSYSDELMDSYTNDNSIFKLWIINKNNHVKASVNILGLDQANSNKLDILRETTYEEGDKIKVWRAGDLSSKIDTLKITGNILEKKEDYSDGIDDIDNMYNVVFEITADGFKSVYNNAPEFRGVEDKVIYKNDAFDKKQGLSVHDIEDGNINISEVHIIGEVNTSRVGDYELVYIVDDSWGRIAYKVVTISVASRATLNTIEFDKNSSSNANSGKNFTIGLEHSTSKYKVTANSTEQFDPSNPNDLYAQITIYNRFGKVIKDIQLLGSDSANSPKLLELNDVSYAANQTLRIYNKNPHAVKVKGKVLSESGSHNNYENGFADEDEMIKTRFKITDDGLMAVKHKDATFNGLTDLTITRGEEVNLFDNVDITHITDEVESKDVVIKGFNNLIVGEQTITYEYTDSWGITSSATRKVIVQPRNELEKNKIQLINNSNNNNIADILFDSIEMKLTANIDKSSLQGINDDELLRIQVFNSSGESKADIDVTKENIEDDSIKAEIESVVFEYEDYVSFEVYDIKNGFKIEGNIAAQLENYADGVDYADNIDNVRFKILENGLESKYNNAPEFVDLDEIEIFRGDNFNPLEGISVTDDIDGDIDIGNISIDKDLDGDTLGKQVLTYTVSDSWGRTTTKERTVWVKSIVDNNKAQFYNSNNELLFEFGFNSKTNQYVLTRGTVQGAIDPSGGSEVAIELTVYDEDGNEDHTITLNADDTVQSQKLNALDGTNYTYGKSMNIKIRDLNKIKFKAEGKYFKSGFEDGVDVDYNNFVTNSDYLDNVRMKITELGIEAMYNKAPKIEIAETNIETYKYKDLSEYNLLEGIVLSDNYDELSNEDITIYMNGKPLTADMLTVGQHTLTYIVKDKWGRESAPIVRTINIRSSIETNVIDISRMWRENNNTVTMDETAVEIKFNTNEMKLKAEAKSNATFAWHVDLKMYRIKLMRADGTTKHEQVITSAMRPNDVVSEWNNQEFEYGDKLLLETNQGKKLKIHGTILDAQEDYSDGVDFGYILSNTVFTITENGLEAKYNETYQDKSGENTITWLAGYNGVIGFRITTDRATGKLKVDKNVNEHIDTEDHSKREILFIGLYGANGNAKYTISLHGRSTANDVFNKFNEKPFVVGDYFEIRTNIKPKNLRITGDMVKDNRINEDYTDGIDDVDFTENVRFYIRDNGIEAVYNAAPVISGEEFGIIVKNRNNQLGEVTVTDDHDAENQITVTREGFLDENQIGSYFINYRATDTWGRSSTLDRFVLVKAAPEIQVHEDKKTVELGSMTTADVDNYLRKELVTISDEEDDRDSKPLNITIKDTINPDAVGTYPITYTVVDSDNYETTETVNVEVIKTINVTVPLEVPFQVVTNLMDKNADSFVAGMLNISNNSTTSVVDVSLKSFEKVNGSGELEIVPPDTYSDWNSLSEEETMKKMALGMYSKEGFNNANHTETSPLWFTSTMNNSNSISIGQLSKANSIGVPETGKLSFVSKHGKKFIGGRSKAKFRLVFEFR